MKLTLSQIRLDGGTQSRAALNEQALTDYAEAMGDGEEFPPVVVFHDGEAYWLADGFHRVRAAERACLVEIEADVRQGSRRDAVLFSVGANAKNGVPRSPEDKKRAVLVLLEDAEWSKWSNNAIAKQASVGDHLVAKIRSSLTSSGRSEQPSERTYKTKHGTVATMNTANIGAKKPAPVAAPVEPAPIRESVDTDSRIAEKPSKPSQIDSEEHARLERVAEHGQRMLRGEATEEDEREESEPETAEEFQPDLAAMDFFAACNSAALALIRKWPTGVSLDPAISSARMIVNLLEKTKKERSNG